MFGLNLKKVLFLLITVIMALGFTGCGSKDNDDNDTPAIPEGKVRVHYHRYNGDYDGWGLHLWFQGGADLTTWNTPQLFTDNDSFGAYTDVNKSDIDTGLSFIVHNGDTKDVNPNRVFPKITGNEVWLLEGIEEIYSEKPEVKLISEALIEDSTTLVVRVKGDWQESDIADAIISDNKGETLNIKEIKIESDGIIKLTVDKIDFSKSYKLSYKKVDRFIAFSRTALQNLPELKYDGNDLGATLNGDGSVTLKLWTPPATMVKVYFYDKADQTKEIGSKELTRGDNCVWSATVADSDLTGVTGSLDGYFYQYEVTAYGNTKRALDPYAKSMAAFKGNYIPNEDPIGKAAVVSFDSANAGVKPSFKGRSGLMSNSVDMVVYEVHTRDFSLKNYADNSEISSNEMGTFKGFIKNIPYLKDLGVTHVQLLPVQNHYKVNETNRSYQGEVATPNYNWGYDPHSYFTLEGWYSTDATNPYKRMAEFRELVKALHDNGIGVIVDVVYNHTMKMDIFENVAPGCYHRAAGGAVPVGNPAVETRNPMARKLIIDSLKMLKNEYGVDGFRFDLMGFIDSKTMQEVRAELGNDVILQGEAWNFTDLNPNDAPIKGVTDVTEHGVSDLAFFNDTSRDSYAGRMSGKGFIQGVYSENPRAKSGLVGGIKGFNNSGAYFDINTDSYNLFAVNPNETLQCLSVHDGFTLWDKINLSTAGSYETKAKMLKQASAMLFTSQGKIIFQGGDEIARTKPLAKNDPESGRAETSTNVLPTGKYFHENAYSSSDYTNEFKWDRINTAPYSGILDYYKGLIKMRREIPAFRFEKADDVKNGVKFIGETAPASSVKSRKTTREFTTFAEMDSLTIKFINGPANSTYYFAGEVHGTLIEENPATNLFSIIFDSTGKGSITFTKAQIADFTLTRWGASDVLNFKLVKTAGAWDAVPGAYSGMGNNNINPKYVSAINGITVDLSIQDHSPGEIKAEAAKFIAYELDNTLAPLAIVGNGTGYTKLIVIHNADTLEVIISSTLITDAAKWSVILDEDDAGITGLTYDAAGGIGKTAVKIEAGKVTVPANSSAVIAVK